MRNLFLATLVLASISACKPKEPAPEQPGIEEVTPAETPRNERSGNSGTSGTQANGNSSEVSTTAPTEDENQQRISELCADGKIAWDEDDYSGARESYLEAVGLGCDDPVILAKIGYTYFRELKEARDFTSPNYINATTYYRRAVEAGAPERDKLTLVWLLSHNRQNSQEVLDLIGDLDTMGEGKFYTQLCKGLAYQGIEKWGEAVAEYTKLIDLAEPPAAAENGTPWAEVKWRALYWRGKIYDYRKGELALAVADYEASVATRPDSVGVVAWKSNVQARANELKHILEQANAPAENPEEAPAAPPAETPAETPTPPAEAPATPPAETPAAPATPPAETPASGTGG
ncbi:MAG: hypothetical protein NUW37_05810 [Planctomycetes bacterium]|nr:hypothetical protein [Planctomycetota bacterium]